MLDSVTAVGGGRGRGVESHGRIVSRALQRWPHQKHQEREPRGGALSAGVRRRPRALPARSSCWASAERRAPSGHGLLRAPYQHLEAGSSRGGGEGASRV